MLIRGEEQFGSFYTFRREFYTNCSWLKFDVQAPILFLAAGSWNTVNGLFLFSPGGASPIMQFTLQAPAGIEIETTFEILINNRTAFNIGGIYNLFTLS